MSLFGRKGEDLTSSFQSHVAEGGSEGVSLFSLPGKASAGWERKQDMLCLTLCACPAPELLYLAGARLGV